MYKRLACLVCFLIAGRLHTQAQLIDYGQNAPGLHWQSLKTAHIELVFPKDYTLRARRMAAILEKTTRFENQSLQVTTRPIPVLLQNQGVESNGFVLLAPRRSEFYTLSPVDQEAGDWLESLGLHEMRHVVQEDKVFAGRNVPLGETLQLGIFGLVYPPWFFEGDAVFMETALSASGRGRLPDFKKEFRANLMSGKFYSYSKYYFGSMRDAVPDYYRLGYLLVERLRREYSDSTYNALFSDALRLRPWPLSASFKRHTGLSTEAYFNHTMQALKREWDSSARLEKHSAYPSLIPRHDSLQASFLLPHPAGKDSVLYLQNSLEHIAGIYLQAGRAKPKLLAHTGLQLSPHFDYAAGFLVWDEQRSDPRYAYHTYSNIVCKNISSGEKTLLGRKNRLFAPSLSTDGTRVIAIYSDLQNRVSAVIIDRKSGRVLRTFAAPAASVFQFPRFNKDATSIICIINSNAGKALYEIDVNSGSGKELGARTFQNLSRPSYARDNLVLYTRSGTETDDIWAFDKISDRASRITHSAFGATAALSSGKHLYFNDYTLRGQNIACVNLEPPENAGSLNPVSNSDSDSAHNQVFFAEKESKGPVFSIQRPLFNKGDSLDLIGQNDSLGKTFTIQPYREAGHLFHIHSLVPSVKQVDLGSNSYLAGLEILSTNLLNTMQAYAAAYYNNSGQSLQYQAGISYRKWYPWISLFLTDRRRDNLALGKPGGKPTYVPFHYRELKYNLSVEVPLSFNIGTQLYQTGAQVLTNITHNAQPSIALLNFRHNLLFPMHYSFYFQKSRLSANRDFFPAFSQALRMSYENYPFEKTLQGELYYLNSLFMFPGIAAHHSLQISVNAEKSSGAYRGDRDITEISGYAFLPANRLSNTLLLSYYFPIAYTDLELSSLAYLKRIRGGLFYETENAFGKHDALTARYSTFGPDVTVECNLLRYYLPVFQLGTRLVFYEGSVNRPKIQFTLNYSL